jgi:hypothetical protein
MKSMRKSFAAIIAGTFLALIMCQTGHADSDGLSLPDGSLSPLHEEIIGTPSATRFPEKSHLVLLPFPFLFSEKTTINRGDTTVLSLLGAFLSSEERMAEKAPMGNGFLIYRERRWESPATDRASNSLDSRQPTSPEYVGICFNRTVGKAKKWRLSLDLGLSLQNEMNISNYAGTSTEADTAFQPDPGGRETDFLDQIRNGAPFIGLGLSCRF